MTLDGCDTWNGWTALGRLSRADAPRRWLATSRSVRDASTKKSKSARLAVAIDLSMHAGIPPGQRARRGSRGARARAKARAQSRSKAAEFAFARARRESRRS